MRLIDTKTGKFVEFVDLEKIPPYAILSHTWDSAGEQSYQEVVKIQEKCKDHPVPEGALSEFWDPDSGLSDKIWKACEIARHDGYRYIWIDSCCIDKASSSELSEAINSMYNWYRGAQVCYAFLIDVPSNEDVRKEGSKFRTSRWFTRGWTLQELIAPLVVIFLSQDWEGLGTKDALADVIEEITSIDRRILTHERALNEESVADRMRWAAGRATTRVEDEAYSLLGIFGITIPTLYGEGLYAFRRLQEEILQRIPDRSLFAWGEVCMPIPEGPFKFKVDVTAKSGTLFAPSPRSFASSRGRTVRATEYFFKSLQLPAEEYIHTPYGIRTQLCLLPLDDLIAQMTFESVNTILVPWYLAVLDFQHEDDTEHVLGRLCYLSGNRANLYVPDWIVVSSSPGVFDRCNAPIFTLSSEDFARVSETELRPKTVYLSHPKPPTIERQLEGENSALNLTLPTWVRGALQMHGYTISHVQGSSSLTLLHASFNIHIHCRHMLIHSRRYDDANATMIEARIWILPPAAEEAPPGSDAAIQSSPPYTATIWTDKAPWAMTFPARSVSLVTNSGDEVTLQLGLDLTAPSRYNLRVEVSPTDTARVEAPSRPKLKTLPDVPNVPHKTFKLTVLGSVRRALETKGYSINLELDPKAGVHSHSLTISRGADSGFSILVQFFHMLGPNDDSPDSQALVVVARATLESLVPHDDLGGYQDGPYVIMWTGDSTLKPTDSRAARRRSLDEGHFVLTAPTGKMLALRLGFVFSWASEFYLRINIEPVTSPSLCVYPCNGRYGEYDPYPVLQGIHRDITLTVPGHITHALQTQGYKVHFQRVHADDDTDPVHYRLTLTKIDAGFVIMIEYSHNLSTISSEPDSASSPPADSSELGSGSSRGPSLHGASVDFTCKSEGTSKDSNSQSDGQRIIPGPKGSRPPRQELIFEACVKVSSSRAGSSLWDKVHKSSRRDGTTFKLDWNARHPWVEGWRRHLPMQKVTLKPLRGPRLTLCLGFYLVWYSEYCLMVEINPSTRVLATR